MARGATNLEEQIAVFGRHVAETVRSLHLIRARTSRVLAATSAFAALEVESRSLREVARTLSSLARANDEPFDRPYVDRELTRLRGERQELQRRFARELLSGAEAERPSDSAASKHRWWRFWR